MVQQGYGPGPRIGPACDKKGVAGRSRTDECSARLEQVAGQGQVEVGVVDRDMNMLPSLMSFDNAGEAPGHAAVRTRIGAEVKPGGEARDELLNVGFGQRTCCKKKRERMGIRRKGQRSTMLTARPTVTACCLRTGKVGAVITEGLEGRGCHGVNA